MDDLLTLVEKGGGKVTKKNSQDPKLFIIGEHHPSEGVIDPKIFFTEIRPEYFLCEHIGAGETLTYQKFLEIKEQLEKTENPYQYANQPFYVQIQEAPDGGTFRTGYLGDAIIDWYKENKETTFVGVDLHDWFERNTDIMMEGRDAIEHLDNYLASLLHEKGSRLSEEKYNEINELRRWLYSRETETIIHTCYHLVDLLGEIKEKVPEKLLSKAAFKSKFRKIEKDIRIFEQERETTMGNTMSVYTAKSQKNNMGLVGGYHIRPDSLIFPILDRNSIPYIAIDIRKDQID